MRLISNYELHHRTEPELSVLFRQVSQGLTQSRRSSAERRNALASLENISRVRAHKLTLQPT